MLALKEGVHVGSQKPPSADMLRKLQLWAYDHYVFTQLDCPHYPGNHVICCDLWSCFQISCVAYWREMDAKDSFVFFYAVAALTWAVW